MRSLEPFGRSDGPNDMPNCTRPVPPRGDWELPDPSGLSARVWRLKDARRAFGESGDPCALRGQDEEGSTTTFKLPSAPLRLR